MVTHPLSPRRSTRARSTPARLGDFHLDSEMDSLSLEDAPSTITLDDPVFEETVTSESIPESDPLQKFMTTLAASLSLPETEASTSECGIPIDIATPSVDNVVENNSRDVVATVVANSVNVAASAIDNNSADVVDAVVANSVDVVAPPAIDNNSMDVVDANPVDIVAPAIENNSVDVVDTVVANSVDAVAPAIDNNSMDVVDTNPVEIVAPAIANNFVDIVAPVVPNPVVPAVVNPETNSETPATSEEVFEVCQAVEGRDRTMSAYFEEVSVNVCQYELSYLKREANKKDATIKNLKENLVVVEKELVTEKTQSKNMIDQLRSQEKDLMEGEKTIFSLREDLLEKQISLAEYIAKDGKLQIQMEKQREDLKTEKTRLEENIQFLRDENVKLRNTLKVPRQQEKEQLRTPENGETGTEIEILRKDILQFKKFMCDKMEVLTELVTNEDDKHSQSSDSTLDITEDLENAQDDDHEQQHSESPPMSKKQA